jgi:serine protease Do
MRTAVAVSLLLAVPAFAQRPNPKSTGWFTDYSAARAEAKRVGKPLFVTIRCEPCVDFARFDGQVVRLAKPLDEFADQFVRVRLNRITGIDLNLFEFDFDCSWFGMFLTPDEVVLGRYGGRDSTSDGGRLSVLGLKYAMERALEKSKAGVKPPAGRLKPVRIEEFKTAKTRRSNDCLHCHLVNEFRRADAKAAGTWDRDDRFVYPLPENVGITIEVDRGDVVKSVAPDSPAANARIQPGDMIARLNGYAVASFADVQYALHKAPKSGSIPIQWRRGTEAMVGQLTVHDGWRKTDLTWRASLFEILPTLPVSAADLTAADKKALGLSETQAAFRQDKFVHSTLKAIGLKAGDVVVAMDGKTVEGTMDDFLGRVRRDYLVGDSAALTVLRDLKPVELKITLK